jgi:hypothetical protein
MPPQGRRIYVGPSSLIEGMELTATSLQSRQTTSVWLKEVQVGAPVNAERVTFHPPAGFREVDAATPE